MTAKEARKQTISNIPDLHHKLEDVRKQIQKAILNGEFSTSIFPSSQINHSQATIIEQVLEDDGYFVKVSYYVDGDTEKDVEMFIQWI